jgi:uncharacterized protein (DUF4415 family)
MREKEPISTVRSKPDGSFVVVHADGREEPFTAPATDLARLDAMTDEDIARQIAADRDVAPEWTEEMFATATVMQGDKVIRKGGRPKVSAPKKQVTLRLDPDVIESYRSTGPRWQSRINETLRAAVAGKALAGALSMKSVRTAAAPARKAAAAAAKPGKKGSETT